MRTTNLNYRTTARPTQFNIHAWNTIKKYADRIWESHRNGESWKEPIRVGSKEFFQMLLDETGKPIVHWDLIQWIPNQRINNWFRELKLKADLDQRTGLYAKAARAYTLLHNMKPSDYVVLYELAYCNFKLRKTKSALANLDCAIEEFPAGERAYVLRAEIYSLLDRDLDALKDLNRTLFINPKNAKAFQMRSGIYLAQDDMRSAQRDLKKALELEPSNEEHYYRLGNLLEDLGDVSMAYKALNKALRLNPFHKDSLYKRALIRLQLKINLKAASEDLLLARSLGHPLAESTYLSRFVDLKQLGIRKAS